MLDQYSAEYGSCTVVAAREQPGGRKEQPGGRKEQPGGRKEQPEGSIGDSSSAGVREMRGDWEGEWVGGREDEEQLVVGLETLQTEFDVARQVITPADLM